MDATYRFLGSTTGGRRLQSSQGFSRTLVPESIQHLRDADVVFLEAVVCFIVSLLPAELMAFLGVLGLVLHVSVTVFVALLVLALNP